jgi:hypothetical protein
VDIRGLQRHWTLLVLPALTAALLALTIALDLGTPASGPGVELAPGYGWSYAVLGLLLAGLGTVVLLHDVRQRFGWALAWLGIFWALDAVAQSYIRYGVRPDDALPAMNAALWFLDRFGAFLPVTVAALLMIFPTGRFVEGRWGRACQAALVLMCVTVLLILVSPSGGRLPATDLPPGVDLDWAALPIPAGVADPAVPVGIVVTIGGLFVAMASVVVRYRRSTGLERDRMRWLLWSVIAMAIIVGLGLLTNVRGETIVVSMLCPSSVAKHTPNSQWPSIWPPNRSISAA